MNPPTDSLYKFMAISGLVIIISILTFGFKETGNLNLEIINLETEVQILGADFDAFDGEIHDLNIDISDTKTAIEEFVAKKQLGKVDPAQINKLVENYEASSEKSLDLLKKFILFKGKAAAVNEKISQLKSYKITGVALLFFAVMISFFGFRRWYLEENKKK